MGVPKFYRWASERYPLINQKVGKDIQFLPVFDNMYLDMNGIIHNCTHPNGEDFSDKLSMKDMVLGMFAYVDRMVHIVRPRKVLVLAVDGCAPRAKMNQQRSRRFASARDRREALQEALKNGDMTEEEAREQFDSNCITPGTEFMDQVSEHFQYYVRLKIKEDPLWRNLKVIYSGHDVPGEGEHKIMDYIRHTRMQPGYDPNTRHCLCGLDADLIMLGLASHEPHFSLLREEVDFTGGRGGKKGGSQTTKEVKKQVEQDKWELLHLSALRQYLDLEFKTDALPFGYNLERIIDDWVLLVMLVGNDFLPHLPSLSIHEGGLDSLMEKYREALPSMGGYITENGKVSFQRLELMLKTIAVKEEQVFRKRKEDFKKLQSRERKRRQTNYYRRAAAAAADGETIDDDGDDGIDEEEEEEINSAPFAQKARDEGIITEDSSFKEKYYGEKFGISLDNVQVIHKLRSSYIEGIQWCYLYYYQGVQSWTWFYPFHYAPLASDLVNLDKIEVKLSKGKPFQPFMQLLSCLPADSAKFLPECYRKLMVLQSSPLADFYPQKFDVDMNGKRNPWEGVNLLPFIDEKRLRDAVSEHCPDELLTQKERDRNTFGHEIIFQLDTSNTATVRSTLPEGGMKDIEVCQTSAKRFLLPPMEKFVPDLLEGTVSNGLWPGDPQLIHGLTLTSNRPSLLRKQGILVFKSASMKESLILNVRPPSLLDVSPDLSDDQVDEFSIASALIPTLDKFQAKLKNRLTVFVDFPYFREAEVVAVADEEYIFNLQEEKRKQFKFVKQVQTEQGSDIFLNMAKASEEAALQGVRSVGTGGVDIGEVEVMFKVRPLARMDVDIRTGATSQVFSDDETWVPYQLICFDNKAKDPRFLPRQPKEIKERLPLQSKVMCLQKTGYGLVGTVVGYEKNAIKAEFNKMTPQIPPFGHTIATSIVDQYISSGKAARHFNIDGGTLGKIAGSVLVKPGRYDIGLNIKVGRGYVVPGYIRSKSSDATKPAWSTGATVTVISGLEPIERKKAKDLSKASVGGGWEYTSRALELIATYRKKFPEVFNALQKHPNTVEYTISEIFGKDQEKAQEKLDAVCKWLEQIDTFRLPLVPISSKTMSRDAILAVQRASDEVRASVMKVQQQATVVVSLPPDVVFKYGDDVESEWVVSPTAHMPPRLGDRVANLGSPVVPFGLGGTVVATHASTGCVEVVFDVEFVGGTSLYGACGKNRGKLLPWNQLLNLSKRAPLTPGKAQQINEKVTTTTKENKNNKNANAKRNNNNNHVNKKTSQQPVKKEKVVPNTNKPAEPVKVKKQMESKEIDHSAALAALILDGEKANKIETPSSNNDDTVDELAKYWLELEGQNKSNRKERRRRREKKTTQAPENNNNSMPKQQQQQQPKPNLLVPPQMAAPSYSAAAQPPPPPQPMFSKPQNDSNPPQKKEEDAEEDPLDVLFKRAAKATGKDYKPPSAVQQQQQQVPPPYVQGYQQPPYGNYPPPPNMYGGSYPPRPPYNPQLYPPNMAPPQSQPPKTNTN